jgi:hypothetical protein
MTRLVALVEDQLRRAGLPPTTVGGEAVSATEGSSSALGGPTQGAGGELVPRTSTHTLFVAIAPWSFDATIE